MKEVDFVREMFSLIAPRPIIIEPVNITEAFILEQLGWECFQPPTLELPEAEGVVLDSSLEGLRREGWIDVLQVIVKVLRSKDTFPITLKQSDYVTRLKLTLQDRKVGPLASMRLVWKGKVIPEGKSMEEIGIKDGDTIQLVWKPIPPVEANAESAEISTGPRVEKVKPVVAEKRAKFDQLELRPEKRKQLEQPEFWQALGGWLEQQQEFSASESEQVIKAFQNS